MSAPPLFRVAHLEKDHVIAKWRQHIIIFKGLQGAGTTVQDIEKFDPSFEFGDRALSILRSGRRQQLELNTEATLESFFEFFSQHRCGRTADNDSAFLARGFDDAFPIVLAFGGPGGGAEKAKQ